MSREPYSDPSQWHDLARLVLNERLESAERTLYCEDRDRSLRARYHQLEDSLVLEESADDHLFGWHTIAVYEGPDLPAVVRGDRESFTAALETYDRGERTRERVKPDIEFADLETHATLVRCKSCGYREVVTGDIGDACRDCCDDVHQYGSPLIDRNTAVDLAAAPFEERLAALEDGPVRDEVLELYETLFPPWDEREVTDGDE
ncbi:hypothetical protein [Natrinema thermotolerans]|uniref:hypothetical protein n=1 Tax=Natrinema thermotolerans TaxID=121872 RepID=UPI0006799938|nr:hypothetical protein [Natrinema thermotolerans]QCC57248.1 hypothetical protein DVR14_00815 [Natrinema thermotolerans]